MVNGLGVSSFFIKSGKEVDSVAANFSRALGARPIGAIQCARGVARPFGAFCINSIASIGLMGTL